MIILAAGHKVLDLPSCAHTHIDIGLIKRRKSISSSAWLRQVTLIPSGPRWPHADKAVGAHGLGGGA